MPLSCAPGIRAVLRTEVYIVSGGVAGQGTGGQTGRSILR